MEKTIASYKYLRKSPCEKNGLQLRGCSSLEAVFSLYMQNFWRVSPAPKGLIWVGIPKLPRGFFQLDVLLGAYSPLLLVLVVDFDEYSCWVVGRLVRVECFGSFLDLEKDLVLCLFRLERPFDGCGWRLNRCYFVFC